ncbi:MAG: polysaccharide deacetylase family protein [Desulfobulbaceae bacterium]
MRYLHVFLAFFLLVSAPARGAEHAVILLYHHVGETTPPNTSVSPELFREQMSHLAAEDFTVLSLGTILRLLEEKRSLPERTVAITFDDAYRSILDTAMPVLHEYGWPCTIFVSTGGVDAGYRDYLTWDDLRRLQERGAEIGNHSHSHAHLVRRQEGESLLNWRQRVRKDITMAAERLRAELGIEARLFAYPYGEHTPELRTVARELGYRGIAQQSGAVDSRTDRMIIPRFPMTNRYGAMDRFRTRVRSRPLSVSEDPPGPTILREGETENRGISFVVEPGEYRLDALACFSSSGEQLPFSKTVEQEKVRVSLRLPPWKAGRRKINCTAPAEGLENTYYWFSRQWLVTRPDGSWYEE